MGPAPQIGRGPTQVCIKRYTTRKFVSAHLRSLAAPLCNESSEIYPADVDTPFGPVNWADPVHRSILILGYLRVQALRKHLLRGNSCHTLSRLILALLVFEGPIHSGNNEPRTQHIM